MPKSYWTRIQTPNGLKYFRADDVTDELMQKIKDAANAFYATYIYNGPDSGNTSYEDIKAAYDAGRAIYVKYKENVSDIGTELFALVSFTDYAGTPTPTTFNHFRFQTLEESTGKTIYRFPGNWGKLSDHTFADSESLRSLKMAIAKDFNFLDFPVAEGTYCTYGYDLYRANQEVVTDTWSDSQWTKVNVMDELTSLISEAGGLFIARYQETTPAELFAAIDSGKTVYVSLSTQGTGPFLQASVISKDAQLSTTYVRFTGTYENDGDTKILTTACNPTGWESVTETRLVGQPNVAPEYSTSQTYAVGDIVYRNSLLYRCITVIDVPENWTAAHWTQTSMSAELSRLIKTFVYEPEYGVIPAVWPDGESVETAIENGCIVRIRKFSRGGTLMYIYSHTNNAGNEHEFVSEDGFSRIVLHHDILDDTYSWVVEASDAPRKQSIAPKYDSESTYDVGDLVYNGLLYRCTTAILTPEAWTPAHWTQTTVAAELNRLYAIINDL